MKDAKVIQLSEFKSKKNNKQTEAEAQYALALGLLSELLAGVESKLAYYSPEIRSHVRAGLSAGMVAISTFESGAEHTDDVLDETILDVHARSMRAIELLSS